MLLTNRDFILATAPLVTYENPRGKRILIVHWPDAFRNPDERARRRQRRRFITWTSCMRSVRDAIAPATREQALKIDFHIGAVHALVWLGHQKPARCLQAF
jgi:hypothetical protein